MSLTKKVYLTISGYDIKLSDNLTFYQKDQLKLIFYINEYGIDYENNATTRALMPVNPLNAILFIENPDGVDSVSSAKIEDNAVTFYLDSTHTQYVGVSRMQLRLFDQDGCAITLPHFTFEIRENIYGSGDVRFQNVVMVDQTGTVILTEDNDMLDVGDILIIGPEVPYPQVAKTIKELPVKHGLDGTEKLIVEDNEATKQAPLTTIVDEIKQNSQEKIREIESELAQTNAQLSDIVHLASKYGVKADGVTDNTQAIQFMTDSLDNGSKIQFPNGLIKIDGDIDYKGKSFNVVVGVNTEFIGDGQMPPMINPNHKVTANYFKLSPSQGKQYQGDSAISVEIQPTSTYKGNAVAIYGGAVGGEMNGELWGGNILLDVLNGYKGNAWGLEIDVNSHTDLADGKEIIGLDITGDGTTNPERGLAIRRVNQKWKKALTLENFIEGMEIKGDENLVILKTPDKNDKVALYLVSNNDLVTLLKNNGHFQTTIVEATQFITSRIVQATNQLLPPSTNNTKIINVVRHELTTTISANALETIQVDLACAGARIGDNVNETIVSVSPLGLFTQAQIAENDKVRITLYNSTNTAFTNKTIVFDVVCYKYSN